MRILLTCLPGFGHFLPMCPVAQELTAAGHEVAFATAERFCHGVVEPAGFVAFPAGMSPSAVEAETVRRRSMLGPDRDNPSSFGPQMFARVAGPAKVADLVGIIERWHPQLIVHDAIDFGAPVAAARCGLPWASHSFGALQPEEFWLSSAELVAPTWQEWDLVPQDDAGMFRYLYLDICPPSLQAGHITGIPVAHRLRPVPFDTAGDKWRLPDWLSSQPERPTVYVTMGTVFNDTPGIFEVVLDALGDAPFNVIATVGRDRDPVELGARPPNVHLERWLPQSRLLAHCDAVVCHGGSGTTLAALANGVPLLLLPQGANQFRNAQRCVELGVAQLLLADDLDAGAVRRAVVSLLEQPDFRAGAHRLRCEIEEMPPPSQAVKLLEELAARDRRPPASRGG